MFLIDTNIFLEILLKQKKKDKCKQFLNRNAGNLCITDFSLHSIGVILFRYGKEKIYTKFVNDILPGTQLLSLPVDLYNELPEIKQHHGLDFDDAYQYSIAKFYGLKIVSMDRDFEKVKDVEVIFL